MTLGDLFWVCEAVAKRQRKEFEMNARTAYTVLAVNTNPKKYKLPSFEKWFGIEEERNEVDKKQLMKEALERGELLKQKLAANGRI